MLIPPSAGPLLPLPFPHFYKKHAPISFPAYGPGPPQKDKVCIAALILDKMSMMTTVRVGLDSVG